MPALTPHQLAEATLNLAESAPEDVTELVLAGREEVDEVQGATLRRLENLRSLDVTCCSIASLAAVKDAPLARLESVCLSRNCVESLAPLEAAKGSLRVLRADDNRVKHLAPLAELLLLVEVTLRRNRIANECELEHLAALLNIKRIGLAGNPFATRMGRRAYRNKVLRACAEAKLEALDGAPVVIASDAAPESELAKPALDADTASSQVQPPPPRRLGSRERNPRRRNGAPRKRPSEPDVATQTTTSLHDSMADGGALARLLATFESDEVLSSLKPAPVPRQPVLDRNRRRAARRVAAGLPAASPASSPRSGENLHEVRYPSHLGATPAVVLRSDGSGEAKYPDGALAVSAEPSPTGGWRVLACYSPGTSTQLVAAVLDADGSVCANFPSGAMQMHLTPEGDGAVWSEKGETAHTFKGGRAVGADGVVTVPLGRNLCLIAQPPPERHVLWFACGGIVQAFRHGRNDARSLTSDGVPHCLHAEAGVVAAPSATKTGRGRPPRVEARLSGGFSPAVSPSKANLGDVTNALAALDADLARWVVRSAGSPGTAGAPL